MRQPLRSRIFQTPQEAIAALFHLPRNHSQTDWAWCWRQENLLAAKVDPNKAQLLKVLRSDPDTKSSVMIRLSEFSTIEAGDLARNGRRFPTKGNRLVEDFVEHNRCHTNAARLWRESHGKTKIVTGLGFVDGEAGGHWYPHSWGLRGSKVVETTGAVADAYFGVVLDPEQAGWFAQLEGV